MLMQMHGSKEPVGLPGQLDEVIDNPIGYSKRCIVYCTVISCSVDACKSTYLQWL